MRVLSVVPRYAVTVGSLKARRGGTVIGKTREERGNCIYSSHCSAGAISLRQRRTTIVPRPLLHYNKLYFDKNFAFTLEIAAFSM